MQKRQIVLAVVIFSLLLVGMFGYAYLKRTELAREKASQARETSTTTPEVTPRMRINAKHFFSEADKVHTLVGEIAMPTPCDLLTYSATTSDEGKRAVVSFDVVNNSKDVCIQLITPQRFKVTFTAQKDATIEALYSNAPADLNLVPAGAGEDPTDFELFIKG